MVPCWNAYNNILDQPLAGPNIGQVRIFVPRLPGVVEVLSRSVLETQYFTLNSRAFMREACTLKRPYNPALATMIPASDMQSAIGLTTSYIIGKPLTSIRNIRYQLTG